MGIRAYSETLDRIDETAWRMNIYDKEYSDAAMTFDTGPDFFSLQYDQKDDQIFEPIMGSSVDFQILVENSALETLINDIATAHEDRFVLEIKREGIRYWVGKMISDDISIPDEDPNFFASLSATDGIGTLKGIKFLKSDGTLYDAKQNFITILTNVLTKISYTSDFYGGGEIFLKTCMRWFEKFQVYDGDDSTAAPLLNTRVHTDFAVKDTNNDDFDTISCYQVLENICKRFKAQLKQINGYFYFVQPIQQAATMTVHTYEGDGSHLSKTTEDHSENMTANKLRSDGVYGFYPPILYAQEQFKAKTSVYDDNLIPYPIYDSGFLGQNPYTISQDQFYADSGNFFIIKTNSDISLNLTDSFSQGYSGPIIGYWEIKLKVGNYYVNYNSSDGVYEFVQDSSARVDLNVTLTEGQQGTWTGSTSLNFTTEEIPTLDDASYEIIHKKFELDDGSTLSTSDYNSYNFTGYHLVFNGLLNSKKITFKAINQETGNNIEATEFYDLGTILIGDQSGGKLIKATGMIEYYDGWEWRSAKAWQIEQQGQNVNISRLGVREAARAFYNPLKNFSAIFRNSAFTPLTHGTMNGYEWIFNGGTFDAKRGQWDANFIRISLNDNSVEKVITEPEIPDPSPSPGNQQIKDTVKEEESVEEQDTKLVTRSGKDFQVSESLLYPNSPSGTDDQDLINFNISDNKVKRQTNYLHTLGLKNLTAAEVDQLKKIDSAVISNTQWKYLAELDQSLKTGASVEFNKIAHGAQFVNVRQITSGNASLNDNDYIIVYTGTASGDVFTISGATGRVVVVSNNSSTNTLDLKDDSATIDGSSVVTLTTETVITIIKIDSGQWIKTSKY